MLKQHVLNTIKKYGLINYGDGIVVGISGGYDSVCLLHILSSISEEFSLKLYPVHINHMLRGQEALRDESFVRTFCSSLGLEAIVERIDIAKKAADEKISLEEAGRNARYAVFNRISQEKSAQKVAVAHSKNDQVETLLMRIFRGTGPEGLKGIEFKRDNIIRPLLETSRELIEEYVDSNGLQAIIDSSNLHTDYFRNRIRLNVIPEINKAIGNDITENLLRLSKIIVADEDYLRYNSELYYKKAVTSNECGCIELDLKLISTLHKAVLSRVLRNAFTNATGNVTGLEYVHIEKLMQLVWEGRTGARLDLPMGYMAVKSYNSLTLQIQEQKDCESFEYILNLPGITEIHTSILRSEIKTEIIELETDEQYGELVSKNKHKQAGFFDFDKIKKKLESDNSFQLVVRNRRDGDIFKPLKSNGTKKLKEYFIDSKIPKNQRSNFPLIAINKEIIWIIGNKTSDNYKVTDNTKFVLMLSLVQK